MSEAQSSSIPGPIQRERLLRRFLEYVRVGTTADPSTEKYPSSEGQWVLGKLLVQQMLQMGIEDAHQDEHGLVWGTIPSTVPGDVPTILFNAHMDTSPEAPGDKVNPQVIENYQGGDIPLLAKGKTITVDQCPALREMVGTTLITTDGTTLLGGDDKAGIAIIMELAAHLIERPYLAHGPIRILFTCDEEIGRGTKRVDLKKTGAKVGYTLDGGGAGTVDQETFSADMAIVKFTGANIHPSIGKGRMVNAIRAASKFVDHLPLERLAPESTDGRMGFIHPYDLRGGVGSAELHLILRDFDTAQLAVYAEALRDIAKQVEWRMPGLKVEVTTERQYRNMADGIRRMPLCIELAEAAFEKLGRPCKLDIIRGGTDGALLTEMGLPTPNLSSGQHNIHSVLEFACLDQMQEALEHLIVLVDLWQQHGRS